MPNVSIPYGWALYLCQPNVESISTEITFSRGSERISFLYSSLCKSNKYVDGIETTFASTPFSKSNFFVLTAKSTSLPVASKITSNERHNLFKILSENFDTHIYTASNTDAMSGIYNHGTCNSLTEMPVIFNSSKININTTSKAIRSGIPLRVFDILSCGGFLISNFQQELLEFFTPGKDLVMYSSLDECVELCRYYLERENERRDIASAGLETLTKFHTYKIRLAQMITTGFEV